MVPENKTQNAMLGNNWLDTSAAATLPGKLTTTADPLAVAGYCQTVPSGWSWSYTYPSKIRLKLSEVEKLRTAAKKDKALREVLQKFTGHIEIEVDFE